MKKSSYKPNPEIEPKAFQQVRQLPKHQFQWSRGVATCSCGYWKLWGATLESAKRTHAYHRRNRWEVESQPVGYLEPDGQGGEPEVPESQ